MFLFINFITSRILCIVSGVWAIANAWSNGMGVFETLILTTLSWLFFIGPIVFDEEWDGTYSIDISDPDNWKATPNMNGGFIMNAFVALIVSCIPLLFGSDPLTLSVIPVIIQILNLIKIISVFRR